jgi:hypothetical protein
MTRKAKQFLDEESGKFLTQGQIKRQRELDREWKNMYERLKAFHKTSGHSNVLRSDPDKALAGWVHGQRNRYSKGKRKESSHPFTLNWLSRVAFVANSLTSPYTPKSIQAPSPSTR